MRVVVTLLRNNLQLQQCKPFYLSESGYVSRFLKSFCLGYVCVVKVHAEQLYKMRRAIIFKFVHLFADKSCLIYDTSSGV